MWYETNHVTALRPNSVLVWRINIHHRMLMDNWPRFFVEIKTLRLMLNVDHVVCPFCECVSVSLIQLMFLFLPSFFTPSWYGSAPSWLFPTVSCLADVTFSLTLLSFPCLCVCVCVKEYVTVGQLNQMYGMPKVESSPTSPLRQPPHAGAVDPAFSCLPSPHGSSLSLSVEVCVVLSRFPPALISLCFLFTLCDDDWLFYEEPGCLQVLLLFALCFID